MPSIWHDTVVEERVAGAGRPVYSPFAKLHYVRGLAQGRIAGARESVLAVLDARGLEVTESERRRVLSVSDPGELRAWLRRAATVAAVSELFGQAGRGEPTRAARPGELTARRPRPWD